MMELMTPVSAGEVIDKLTILEIKAARIVDADKLANVERERAALQRVVDTYVPLTPELERLWRELRAVNEKLWTIEDDIRACESSADFGETFIELARSVYVTNDERARLKKEINLLTGSALVEEKSYADYKRSA